MEKKKITPNEKEINKPASESTKEPLYDCWPEEGVKDILDYIEEQGVYIRE